LLCRAAAPCCQRPHHGEITSSAPYHGITDEILCVADEIRPCEGNGDTEDNPKENPDENPDEKKKNPKKATTDGDEGTYEKNDYEGTTDGGEGDNESSEGDNESSEGDKRSEGNNESGANIRE
jgi:hypothetical protein